MILIRLVWFLRSLGLVAFLLRVIVFYGREIGLFLGLYVFYTCLFRDLRVIFRVSRPTAGLVSSLLGESGNCVYGGFG